MAPTAKSTPTMVDDNPANRPMLIAKIPAPMRIGRSTPPTLHVMITPPLFKKKWFPFLRHAGMRHVPPIGFIL